MAEGIFHPEFDKAGKKAGMQIWRIEDMEMKPIPAKNYGHFFIGDAYIVLHSKASGSRFSYRLHFWLGDDSSQDEQGAAAMLATQLDDFLGGDPVQYRETQQHESETFKSYFKSGITYKKGGHASGFHHVETNQFNVKRLLHVKGRKNVTAVEVDFAWSSFNLGDVFIVDLGKIIIQWNGPESNRMERLKGTKMAKDVRDNERAGRAQVYIVDGENERGEKAAFDGMVKILGAKPSTLANAVPDEKASRDRLSNLKLFHVSDDSGQLTVQEVATKPLTQDLLNHNDCYILDQGGAKVYVWKGKHATPEERSGAMARALGYMAAKQYDHHTQAETVPDGSESMQFKQLFKSWRVKGETVGRGSVHTKGRIAKVKHVKFDATSMHAEPQLAAQHRMVDDGSGDVEIWRIEGSELVAVNKKSYGQFYGGDCYVILYTYENAGRKQYIVYFWQGRHATQDEIAASAFHTVALDDKYGGAPVQVRVVMGKEPKHFMAMFKGQMIIYEGGTSREGGQSEDSPIRLFQVKGSDHLNTKAIEVKVAAASLNSNDVFLLKSPKNVWMWCGKGCSGDEREMTKHLSTVISKREIETLSEGTEPALFWATLGGKAPYADGGRMQEEEGEDHVRLFECSNASGNFRCEEIAEFTQEDLDEDDVMLLDSGSEVFLWIGKGSNKQEQQESVLAAVNYLRTDPTGSRDPHTPIIKVKQGFEPPTFTGWFMAWDPSKWSENKSYDQLKKELGGKEDVFEHVIASLSATTMNGGVPQTAAEEKSQSAPGAAPIKDFYSLEELTEAELPEGLDLQRKEAYLTDEDFEELFGMDKDAFTNIPKWRQDVLRKKHKLF